MIKLTNLKSKSGMVDAAGEHVIAEKIKTFLKGHIDCDVETAPTVIKLENE